MACFVMARIPLYVCSLLVLLGVNVMRLLGFQDKHIKVSEHSALYACLRIHIRLAGVHSSIFETAHPYPVALYIC